MTMSSASSRKAKASVISGEVQHSWIEQRPKRGALNDIMSRQANQGFLPVVASRQNGK
jgi:hypothetical protein